MTYRYSATQWIYGSEDIAESLARLQKYGYDGVEFAAEPGLYKQDYLQKLLDTHRLKCSSLCGIYTQERNLSSSDKEIRQDALKYLKDSIDMASALHASTVIVVPSSIGKLSPDEDYQTAWAHGVSALKEAAGHARLRNVFLAIEAVNRYETFLLTNLTLALKFVEEVGHPHVGLMADLFHMNLEERDILLSLNKIQKHLFHVHIADNTREAAGVGQTDFSAVLKTLQAIDYQGWLTMEFMPPVSDPYSVSTQGQDSSLMDKYTKQSIEHLKKMNSQ